MELFTLLSFLSSFIPLLIIIAVVKAIGSSLFDQTKGKKSGAVSKYQEFMKEINQEKDRLRNVPTKKEASNQEVSRVKQKAANITQQRNNPYLSTKKDQYQQPKVKSQPLAERNRIQAIPNRDDLTRSYPKMAASTKKFVQTNKQVSKKKKQTPYQKDIIKGIVYKEILDKPRALRPYR